MTSAVNESGGATVGHMEVGDGIVLAYRISGSGSPLLLVAGTGYPGATWPPGMVEILAETHSVITYDHRGTGESSSPPGPYSTRNLAGDALLLLQGLDAGPAHVLGHSMGGRVGQWMAIDGGPAVRTLILAASGAGVGSASGHVRKGVPPATVLGLVELGYEEYIRDLQRRTFFTEECGQTNPKLLDWLARAFWEHRPDLASYLEHVTARQEHSTVDYLGAITCPTLVLVGSRDTHAGGTGSHLEQSQYLAEHISDTDLHVLDGVKHGFFWERPKQSTGVVRDWLGAREGRRAVTTSR